MLEEKIKKELLNEMELLKMNLDEDEISQLAEILAQMKKTIAEQEMTNGDAIKTIDRYMKSTVTFIEELDEYSDKEENNSKYDTAYAALVMKKSSTLGVANAVRLMLKTLDIDSRIKIFKNNKRNYISYYVITDVQDFEECGCDEDEDCEDCKFKSFYCIDPYNDLLSAKLFLKPSTLDKEGEFFDLH